MDGYLIVTIIITTIILFFLFSSYGRVVGNDTVITMEQCALLSSIPLLNLERLYLVFFSLPIPIPRHPYQDK